MHYICKYLISACILIVCCLQQCCLAQSTTVRPYKFGFTIEEQQHRSEKRDERGIVMGEFGFITADGIYHVTVYATDEQGRFRILAMKNYPYKSPPKTMEVMVKLKTPVTTTTTQKPLTRHNFNTQACSGCFLTNGNNKPNGINSIQEKGVKSDIRPLSKPLSDSPVTASNPKVPKKNPATASKPNQSSPAVVKTSKTTTVSPPAIMDLIMQEVLPTLMGNQAMKPSLPGSTKTTKLNNTPNVPSVKNPSSSKSALDSKGQIGGSGSSKSNSGNGDGDLYRFKYTLDYNGHTETGKRNGNKEGSYYAIGDDNVERSIEYVANEFGYQPRIRFRKLDRSESKPKENTLKDYEFVWFKQ